MDKGIPVISLAATNLDGLMTPIAALAIEFSYCRLLNHVQDTPM